MAKEKIIYLGPEEELTSVRERLENATEGRIILIIPAQTQLLSRVGWGLLHSQVRKLGKDVLIISSNRQIRAAAKAAGFRVADSIESPPSDRFRPSNRPVRSDTSGKTSEGINTQGSRANKYSRPYELPTELVAPPRSEARVQEDSEIDSFEEEYYVARSIREAAQEGDAGAKPSTTETPSLSSSTLEQSSTIPPQSGIDDDPFAYMENIQSVALPEQRASMFIQDIDQGIPDISDVPPDVHDVKIEDLGDAKEIMPRYAVPPQARGEPEPIPVKPNIQKTRRIYGIPLRSSRVGNTVRPSLENRGDENDLLPPSITKPNQPRRVTPSSPPHISDQQMLVDQRIEDLRSTGVNLAKIAKRLSVRAMTVKTLLILLGALVATREIATQLFGLTNNAIMVIYTLMGVLIATLAGLEAAFKWENRSIELKNLAANCRNQRRKLESKIYIADATPDRESLLDALDNQSAEVQEKAASLGVNVVLELDTAPMEHHQLLALRDILKE